MPVAQFKVKKPTRPRDTRDSCDTRRPNDRTEIRQLLTGHATAEMNKNYTHHELEPLRAAVKVIPSIKVK